MFPWFAPSGYVTVKAAAIEAATRAATAGRFFPSIPKTIEKHGADLLTEAVRRGELRVMIVLATGEVRDIGPTPEMLSAGEARDPSNAYAERALLVIRERDFRDWLHARFPPPGGTSAPATPNAAPVKSAHTFRAWYRLRAAEWPVANTPPTETDDLLAARQRYGDAVSRATVRAIRRELAPSSWRKPGPRGTLIGCAARTRRD